MQPKKKHNAETVGIVFGSFTPFHVGHDYLIKQALNENDYGVVFVSDAPPEKKELMEHLDLNLSMRYYYLKEEYKERHYAIVRKIDESKMPAYPNGWNDYLNAIDEHLENEFRYPDNMDITVYTRGDDFVEEIKALRPNWQIKQYDPEDIPFDSQQLIEEPIRYQNVIMKPYRKHMMEDYDILHD